ncbi:hypothetical protein [Microbacterium sp.]|uniref:hypothetical protein n=1 Tax=Microbacterium sp. TaxID=51671 RepID=UPI0039E53603
MSDERMPGTRGAAGDPAVVPGDAAGMPGDATVVLGDVAALPVAPRLEAPTDDVEPAPTAALPGEHRGGFQRELTGPVPIAASIHTEVGPTAPVPAALPHSAGWALTFAILGLIVSLLVGWGFLIGLLGLGLAIAALRRPWEARGVAIWALCLSLVSIVYSAGWLWWASTQGPLFG